MHHLEAERSSDTRSPRNWIIDTLVVAGIVAFGYFAVTLDSLPWDTAAPQPPHPVAEFIR